MASGAMKQEAPGAPDQWEDHYQAAVRALVAGRLTPFLGAGANLCGRDALDEWQPRHEHLPSGGELAHYLATAFDYPYPEQHEDLVRISQFISIMDGPGPLMDTLHDLFDADYPPTMMHRFLAEIPSLFRAADRPVRYQMIVTTNYDDALERAFVEKQEPYDLISYMTAEPYQGRFVHWAPGEAEGRVIDNPQEYIDLSPQQRTVILKIHGLVDRVTPERQWDSFVITEDHYIDYLTRTDISKFPAAEPDRPLQAQQLPVPRVQPARLEPAGDSAADLAGAAGGGVHELGGAARPGEDRQGVLGEAERPGDRGPARPVRRTNRRHAPAAPGGGRARLSGGAAAAQAARVSPYKGLAPYSAEDASFFFGRTRERDVVIANLRARHLTVVYGESGVGKSSLLRAGVLSELQQAGPRRPRGPRHARVPAGRVQHLA